ncbi:MAG: TusE/DsrC/DsvC family sulfur relay protein [Deltaproteobacteria bacterium]|nr:TusE/DsrC/DsvC family sulfur relay protein [Deltaproteobacteria bacterium]
MNVLEHKGKSYSLDATGFLSDPKQWDENFAEGIAPQLRIEKGLTKEHWDVIYSIRSKFRRTDICPTIYETCRENNLRRKQLKKLFPTGYQRGACKLAGISFSNSHKQQQLLYTAAALHVVASNKTYTVDARGFLIDPEQWDERYAIHRAHEMKIPGGKLTEKHWEIINFLREGYNKNKDIPLVYETCEANRIELEDLEKLFPDGYLRGAVKIAGLRLR